MKTGLVPFKETLPGEMSPECGHLGTGKNQCTQDFQERVSAGDGLHEYGSRRDPSTHGGKNHKCKEYGNGFENNQFLLQHKWIHTIVKQSTCSKCGEAFLRQAVLTSTAECVRKAFRRRSHLRDPWRIHNGGKLYMYGECGKPFARRSGFEKLYECSECGKTYSHRSTLTTHQKLHSGVKAHKCKRCGKAFYRNTDLGQHQRTHTEFQKRPF
ncbi:zinc finger protein 80-like [Suricata suricatta]|uniref:zinc finger protein 80-like n=1 Tax=Suricata suricatta TaxID=37032 RepID=UPI001155D01D|nr:zinc finger protein 80-like [Suricata suricatta]